MHDAQVQLAVDLQSLFDQHPSDLLSFRAGLMGDQRHANHLLGDLLGLIGRSSDLDASALAAAAGVNLRLDDHDIAAQTSRDVAGFCRRKCDFTARNWNTEPGEDCFAWYSWIFTGALHTDHVDQLLHGRG